ncbi:hypothetical protein O181_041244 [Austropuccinia psidii MF-1]|uniref:DUF202 domain-containing protein n=1 Tax=Austropuccinia psidii MF-1 TaxID=1389203 RepID=A0A9Q3DDU5_9BASI|nr:hypothetical protein [Austropuccinia psidii MF-1]
MSSHPCPSVSFQFKTSNFQMAQGPVDLPGEVLSERASSSISSQEAVNSSQLPTNPTSQLSSNYIGCARHALTKRVSAWRSLLLLPVVHLENKSSVARDHLANERTYLAWLRTSLALSASGIAATQLFRLTARDKNSHKLKVKSSSEYLSRNIENRTFQNETSAPLIHERLLQLESLVQNVLNSEGSPEPSFSEWIGVLFILLGVTFLLIGTYRYFEVQQVLQSGQFPPSKRAVSMATIMIICLLIAAASGFLIVGH